MPHGRLSADLSFLHEKVDFGFSSHKPWNPGSNKQTALAQVLDS